MLHGIYSLLETYCVLKTKDLATRYERSLVDAEVAMEKSKSRFDTIAEELERVVVAKEGESIKDLGVQQGSRNNPKGRRAIGNAVAKGGLLLKGRNPASVCLHFMIK
jgi:hypothetical protein